MKSAAFHTIGIIGKYGEPAVAAAVLQLGKFLRGRGCEILLEAVTAKYIAMHGYPIASMREIAQQADLVITVGGDGTLLGAARELVNFNAAILGINLGRLGFLVDISPADMTERLTEVFDGNYLEEHRMILTATITHKQQEPSVSDAFNDVVVHKWDVARMIETECYINGRLLNRMRGDGLIVSTPTGSTAYALSGGGPIIEPDMNAIELVPICPHSMSYRPIVVDGDSTIEIIVCDGPHTQAQVTCDGQINMGLVSGDKVMIQRKAQTVRLIHPMKHDYYLTLRAKLHWGEQV
ncbi:MAG: NAD(+) kinase [Gammaproteobacteria bacterium]|nr:NAD(+) kinase [Gammaproteobacteria bacterium]